MSCSLRGGKGIFISLFNMFLYMHCILQMSRPRRGYNQNGKNNKRVKNKTAQVIPEPKNDWLCRQCNNMISAKITTAHAHRDACNKIKVSI